jgi:group I intron endonuclease
MRSGVYCIRNTVSGRVYVGSAVDLHRRWIVHRSKLGLGKHHSPALQRSWIKHGAGAFIFEVLEEVEPALLIEREQYWIDTLDATDPFCGANVEPCAASSLGRKHTEMTRARMSASRKGRKHPPRTAEYCAKQRIAKTGNQYAKGHRKTAEQRTAMRAAKLGKPAPWTVETNRRRKGISRRSPSMETRAKISASKKGKRINYPRTRGQAPPHNQLSLPF